MKKGIAASGLDSNRFEFVARKGWWPPFFATSFFLPRLRLRLVNKGDPIDVAVVEVKAAAYDGPLMNIASVAGDWRNAAGERVEEWETGATRKLRFQLGNRALPRAGTYIVRVTVVEELPQPAEVDRMIRSMSEAVDSADTERAVAIASELRTAAKSPAVGPPGQSHTLMYRQVFDATLHEYLQVDSLATVLTFWSLITALLVGIGTVLIGLAALLT